MKVQIESRREYQDIPSQDFDGSELPDVGSENQVLALCNNSKNS